MAKITSALLLLVAAEALNIQDPDFTKVDKPKDKDKIQGIKKKSKKDDPNDVPRIDDPTPAYNAPFNLTNGACKLNQGERYVMEITNVAHGSYYIGKMGFGTPTQWLNMLLDTGSDEIVVKAKGCAGCEGRGYNHSESSTYQINKPANDPEEGQEEISYGSGDVWGQHVFDTVHMGPLSGPHMDMLEVSETTIQEFAETTDTALEVITGMAPGLPEYVGQRLASHMEVRHFSQCLPQNSDENGFFVLNDASPKSQGYAGPFMSMGNYYWAVSIDAMRFDWTPSQKAARVRGASEAHPLSKRKFSMLVDTGTTLLSLPQDVMDELDAALDHIDGDCAKMDQLPSLAFELDGITHSLPPSTYIAEDSGGNDFYFPKGAGLKKKADEVEVDTESDADKARSNLYYKGKKFVNSKTGAECHLLFTQPITMNSTLGGEIGILGMPLFRNYVVSFDFCQRQIWTKPHYGDCSQSAGQHPSNADFCADGDWLFCFFKSLGEWFVGLFEGFGSIFAQESTMRQGPRLKYQPGTERISAAARSLLDQSLEGGSGIVEL